ncbi:MAG: mechanosensitive ion channel family protein [Peptococcaceae bacterium]|jgi:small conductance mechanosensitive channel|nr:mechanosensitive ion channel family protein [Peptococcaceae bacterium]
MSYWLDKWKNIPWESLTAEGLRRAVYVLVILLAARLVYAVLLYALKRVLFYQRGKSYVNQRKADTLFPLLKNAIFYILTFTVAIHILSRVFNFNTSTLLASAGILGVAVGFGSQSLVKDMIGGFFILFDDQFSVGESIKAGEFSGTVEEIGLRTTRLRNAGGELHILPNGGISSVTNYNRGKMKALVDIYVPYGEDLVQVKGALQRVCEEVGRNFADKLAELPSVLGIVQFGERNAVWRVCAFAKANEQALIERELREGIYQEFRREGIKAPLCPEKPL